jgi:hypothetical protein
MKLSLVEIEKLTIDARFLYQKRALILKEMEIANKMKELNNAKSEMEFTISNVAQIS